MTTYSVEELSKIYNVTPRTIRRWIGSEEKLGELGWVVESVERWGGRVEYRITTDAQPDEAPCPSPDPAPEPEPEPEPEAEKILDRSAVDATMAAVADAVDDLPVDARFEQMLHKKLVAKEPSQRSATAYYYRKQYRKTGKIPKGLLHRDGRKAAGRKGGLAPEIEARFCKMVEEAATADKSDPEFMTRNLRKVTVFHRKLCAEFGPENVSLSALYRAKKRNHLDRFFQLPDYEETETSGIYYFNPEEVFDLIQMDGCTFKYLEMKDPTGRWRKPLVIEFYDTGSRAMLAMDLYFSESSENSVDIFSQFLLSGPFPKKTIRIRPDQAAGFRNLKRPIHELNLKHSTPGRFYLDADYARVHNPKAKVHLETSHRRLHDFEAWVIEKTKDRIVERRPGTRFAASGRVEKITVTRIDAELDDIRHLIREYQDEHNARTGRFVSAGVRAEWTPKDRLAEYLENVETISFSQEEVEEFIKYGFEKKKGRVQKSGRIQFDNHEWKIVSGDFSRQSSTPVKISEVNGKLFLFEDKPDGLAIGEAMPVTKYEKPEFVNKRAAERLKANEYELLIAFLEESGMVVNRERLLQLYKEGLNLEIAMALVRENADRYNSPKWGEKQGFVAFNLLISDWMQSRDKQAVKPYAGGATG